MLLAASLFGYVAAATVFYYLSAKSAVRVEDNGPTMPIRVALTVVEGGKQAIEDTRKIA